MPAKRATAKAAPAQGSSHSPAWNAAIVGIAIAGGIYLLVARGRLSWPPTDLLANAYTLAGCLAVVGPVVLFRREASSGAVGEMLWLTGGILIWIFDLAAMARGEARLATLTTPIASRTMGLMMMAVLVAAWKTRGEEKSWSWTNVTGWVLGLFWVTARGSTSLRGREQPDEKLAALRWRLDERRRPRIA